MPNIARWDPLALNSNLRQVMEWMFDDPFFRYPSGLVSEEGTLALDISQNGKEVVVTADLPGFKKKDIDVQLHDGILSIRAQHSEEHEEKGDHYYHRERSWGSVSRRVALPGVVRDAPVEGVLKDGVLTLHIPVPEQAGPKQIEIKTE